MAFRPSQVNAWELTLVNPIRQGVVPVPRGAKGEKVKGLARGSNHANPLKLLGKTNPVNERLMLASSAFT